MNPVLTGLLVFGCVFGAALLAMRLRAALPQHHLSADTKDTVKLAMGLVATMTALVLGLLVASAKGSYDTARSEITQMAAKFVVIDRILANYGPAAAEPRKQLRDAAERTVVLLWPDSRSQSAELDPSASSGETLYDAIQKLSPQNDEQRWLKSQCLALAVELGQMRWLLFEQSDTSISTPFLVVVVCWLAIIFFSFGLFAPSNSTVIATLLVAALSVSGAIFLILELDPPFRRDDPDFQPAHAHRFNPSRTLMNSDETQPTASPPASRSPRWECRRGRLTNTTRRPCSGTRRGSGSTSWSSPAAPPAISIAVIVST